MPLLLRDYQTSLAKRAARALEKSKSVVVQLETGAGKTHIAAKMCRAWHRQGKHVWFIAHRREILSQAQRIFEEAGIPHGSGKSIEFRMIASAVRASKQDMAPDVLIFDECHHAPAKTWAGVVASSPKALRLGLTATPGRLDGAPLGDYFAEMVQGPSPKELRDAGHLARYRYFAPVVPDLSHVKVRKEEYDRAAITEIMAGPSIVGDVVEHYQRHAAGKRAILFAVSVDASRDMAERFNRAGVPALHIDADTPDDERAAAIAAVRRGRVKVLCNVELFTEGFDLPAIDAVILLRPTRSLALFRQMLGRGARPSGRTKTIILDHAALVAEHGLPDEEYAWTLDGKPPRRKIEIEGGARTRMRRCPECNAVHVWAAACEECGHEYVAGAREVTEIGGRLEEVSRPPGCVTKSEYARMRGVNNPAVGKWVKKGMPTTQGFIDQQKADEWRINRRGARAEERLRTPGYVTLAEYARMRGLSDSMPWLWKKRGIPTLSGYVEPQKADEWRQRYREEQSALASKSASERMTPERRAELSVMKKKQLSTPESREAITARMREYGSSPEGREANRIRTKSRMGTPAARAAASARAKKQMMNQELREALSARAKARLSNPEARAALSARAVAQMENPEARASLSARAKEHWSSQQLRAKKSESMREQWSNPGYRSKMIGLITAGQAARKARKLTEPE